MINTILGRLVVLLILLVLASPVSAQTQSFDTWLSGVKYEAAQKGISQGTINAALQGIQPIQRVIELDRKQPEWKKTFADYKQMIVNETRVKKGRQLIQDHSVALNEIEKAYGVPKEFIVALWGIETNFGSNTGGFKVVPALATLAWEGRRAAFFKKELLNALKIIDEGHISAASMKGSWAGAMGQNQFMPSSFNAYAVDHDKDGRRDIWGTKIDVFASSANYLKKNGWRTGERWGRRVTLPSSFPKSLITPKVKKSIAYWSSLGVRDYNGGPLPTGSDMLASIVAPDGKGGEAYMVYNNYQTIMHWNRSTYFATSVGLLADRLSQ